MTTYNDIIKQINAKTYAPIYLLEGEETYYIDLISDYIEENVLDESEKDFNLTIMYGKETNIGEIISSVKRYPMMSNYNVVILKEAQSFDKLDELEKYFQSPDLTTIFVICYKYKKADKRKTFVKAIAKNGIIFTSDKLYDNQVQKWIEEYCKKFEYKIDSKSNQMLIEFIGNDLSKISNELDKLFILIPKGTTITPSIIEKNIGISKDYNAFELTKAFSNRNYYRIYSVVQHFEENSKDNPPQKVIPMMFPYFQKLLKYHFTPDKSRDNLASVLGVRPNYVEEYIDASKIFTLDRTLKAISIMREYDLKSKGLDASSGVKGSDLIKEMVIKIIS